MRKYKALEVAVQAAPDKQISLTDPDARSMATSGKDTGRALVGYNVQAAVDTQHHLIVAHEDTKIGNDRSQLSTIAKQAQAAMGVRELTSVADRGYFKGEEILACEAAGVTPFVPKLLTSSAKAHGRFGKQDFVYDPQEDAYRRPGGQTLTRRFTTVEAGLALHAYWTTKYAGCALKSRCTPAKERRVKRWEHEAILDAIQERLDRAPNTMRIRRQTAEHPFGTIKAWMGATHFRLRTLEKVRTEMSLHLLAYHLKRRIAILAVQPLIQR
jgi:transposase